VAELLEQGFRVRTTLRDRSKDAVTRAAIEEVVATDNLEFVIADLLSDDGWDAAVAGCRYVLHPASPLGGRDEDTLIRTAREGAVRVIAAAHRNGIERVVLTSAANTSSPSSYRTPGVTDETLWTDPNDPSLDAYRRSKTLAELAAWEYVDKNGCHDLLTTVLPGAVMGPVLGDDNLGSVQVIGRLMRAEMPRVPKIGLEIVDVRDIADAHVRAMTADGAAGERFLATGELVWMHDVARTLRDELGTHASRVPTKSVPDFVVRRMARRRPEMAGVLPGLGRRNTHTTAKAQRVLGWTPRPAKQAVLDCARSLIAHEAV
jgi:nucleoside-diphosphate-sugar epimerase